MFFTSLAHANMMEPPGKAAPLLPKLITSDDAVATGRMVPGSSTQRLENESPAPSLVERVRSLAAGRRSGMVPPPPDNADDTISMQTSA